MPQNSLDQDLRWDASGPFALYDSPEASTSSESFESFSTNATAPNLPGPGRLLGNAYDVSGRFLESRLAAFLARRSSSKGKWSQTSFNPDAMRSYDTISTNATADNLPGPGRVLDLAYQRGGRILEFHLSRVANKAGFGPDAVVRRIEKRSGSAVIRHGRMSGVFNDQLLNLDELSDAEQIKEACRRLLGYVQSNVTSNQLLALEHIASLSASRKYIRDTLYKLGAVSVISDARQDAFLYTDPCDRLLSRSRKALVSLTDKSLVESTQALFSMCSDLVEDPSSANAMLQQLTAFLPDQDISFLAIRLLSSVIDEGTSLLNWYGIVDGELDVSIVPATLSKLLTSNDVIIDWTSLDQLFLTWFLNLNDGSLYDETADMLVLAFRHASNLPRTVKSLTFLAEYPHLESDFIQENNPICYPFIWNPLERFVDNEDLTEVSPDDLMLISRQFDALDLDRLWKSLLCPAKVVLRQILKEEAVPGLQTQRRKWIENPQVLPQSRFAYLFEKLLRMNRHPHKQTRKAAQLYAQFIRKSNYYYWKQAAAILRKKLKKIQLIEMIRPDITEVAYQYILYRHTCTDGSICVSDSLKRCYCFDRDSISSSGYDQLSLQFWDVMWVEVSPSLPFDPGYYFPLIAGTNGERRRQFIATPVENYWFTRDKIVVISEGERIMVYRDFDGEEMHTDHFRVLVLRFDVESYPKARRNKAKTYGESQGPFYWTSEELVWRPNERDPLKISPVYAYSEC